MKKWQCLLIFILTMLLGIPSAYALWQIPRDWDFTYSIGSVSEKDAVCYITHDEEAKSKTYYSSIDAALSVAESNDTADFVVIIPGTYTLEKSLNYNNHGVYPVYKVTKQVTLTMNKPHTIKSQDRLILPLKEGAIKVNSYGGYSYTKTETDEVVGYDDYINPLSRSDVDCYTATDRTPINLILNANLTIQGRLDIGGFFGGSYDYSMQSPSGWTHNIANKITLDKNVEIKVSGANSALNCYGFIVQSEYNNGSVVNATAGTIRLPFTIYDFRGLKDIYPKVKTPGRYTSPFDIYSFHNIASLNATGISTIKGVVMICSNSGNSGSKYRLYVGKEFNLITQQSSDGLIRYGNNNGGSINVLVNPNDTFALGSGTSVKTLPHMSINSYGECSFNSISITNLSLSDVDFLGLATVSIRTGSYTEDGKTIDGSYLSVPGNIDISVKTGTLYLRQGLRFLPRSHMQVDEGATLNLNVSDKEKGLIFVSKYTNKSDRVLKDGVKDIFFAPTKNASLGYAYYNSTFSTGTDSNSNNAFYKWQLQHIASEFLSDIKIDDYGDFGFKIYPFDEDGAYLLNNGSVVVEIPSGSKSSPGIFGPIKSTKQGATVELKATTYLCGLTAFLGGYSTTSSLDNLTGIANRLTAIDIEILRLENADGSLKFIEDKYADGFQQYDKIEKGKIFVYDGSTWSWDCKHTNGTTTIDPIGFDGTKTVCADCGHVMSTSTEDAPWKDYDNDISTTNFASDSTNGYVSNYSYSGYSTGSNGYYTTQPIAKLSFSNPIKSNFIVLKMKINEPSGGALNSDPSIYMFFNAFRYSPTEAITLTKSGWQQNTGYIKTIYDTSYNEVALTDVRNNLTVYHYFVIDLSFADYDLSSISFVSNSGCQVDIARIGVCAHRNQKSVDSIGFDGTKTVCSDCGYVYEYTDNEAAWSEFDGEITPYNMVKNSNGGYTSEFDYINTKSPKKDDGYYGNPLPIGQLDLSKCPIKAKYLVLKIRVTEPAGGALNSDPSVWVYLNDLSTVITLSKSGWQNNVSQVKKVYDSSYNEVTLDKAREKMTNYHYFVIDLGLANYNLTKLFFTSQSGCQVEVDKIGTTYKDYKNNLSCGSNFTYNSNNESYVTSENLSSTTISGLTFSNSITAKYLMLKMKINVSEGATVDNPSTNLYLNNTDLSTDTMNANYAMVISKTDKAWRDFYYATKVFDSSFTELTDDTGRRNVTEEHYYIIDLKDVNYKLTSLTFYTEIGCQVEITGVYGIANATDAALYGIST